MCSDCARTLTFENARVTAAATLLSAPCASPLPPSLFITLWRDMMNFPRRKGAEKITGGWERMMGD